MSRLCNWVVASCLLAASVAAPVPAQPATEVENVAAFARLYGVVRWFYPSDAAADLDWNRFAVYGVQRVRGARSARELESTLQQLFTPLGPGILIASSLPPATPVGPRDAELVAWHYRGPGFSEIASGAYSAKRVNRLVPAPPSQQNTASILTQSIAADSLRGRAIRLRARVRVADANAAGWAGLWLRVDRPNRAIGFFDNMQGRPVRDTSWRSYVIEGVVADDATQVVFGALAVSEMSADVDGFELAVRRPGGEWTPLTVRDAGFEADAETGRAAWSQSGSTAYARLTGGAAEGERFLRIPPVAATRQRSTTIARAMDTLETPITGATSDFALARGLRARVPLSLTDADARAERPELAALRTAVAATPAPARRDDADVRIADIVVAWSALRHFSPYWSDIAVNWDTRLQPQITAALAAPATRQAHGEVVRRLVADMNDGHGSVTDIAVPRGVAPLPLSFRILADRLVVTATDEASVPVGSVVTRIGGTPASSVVRDQMALASGTPQWKRTRAEAELQLCRLDAGVTLTIEPPQGAARDVTLPCARSASRATEARPDSLTELEPGVWYVDLTRVQAAALRPMLPTLAKASGVVFDLRGYPTDAGAALLPHLMTTVEQPNDRWMHIPRYARPFAEASAWMDLTWGVQPTSPRITGQRVFLTDGRAISYAESVMGYVRDYKLGTIIGGTTAGANGNIASFTVPGGFSIVFTGMRVTRHDGRTPYHVVGVTPDIPLEPSLEAIRAGRDEGLARALAVLRARQ